MKDLMKRFFLFLTLAVTACGFVACSDDDDNVGADKTENLYGRWTLVKEVWFEDGEQGVDVYQPGEYILFLDEDGTGYEQENENGYTWTWPFTYMVSGKTLQCYDDGDYWQRKIASLSSTTLILIESEVDKDGYYKYNYEQHYTRY